VKFCVANWLRKKAEALNVEKEKRRGKVEREQQSREGEEEERYGRRI